MATGSSLRSWRTCWMTQVPKPRVSCESWWTRGTEPTNGQSASTYRTRWRHWVLTLQMCSASCPNGVTVTGQSECSETRQTSRYLALRLSLMIVLCQLSTAWCTVSAGPPLAWSRPFWLPSRLDTDGR